MLMSELEFMEKYGDIYNDEMARYKSYVDDPSILRRKVDLVDKERDLSEINKPYADMFSHEMTYARGFVEYPERLKNYIVAKNEPKAELRSFYPYIMDIEPNARCNFRCIMCQVSEWDKMSRGADDMTYDELVAFIEENPYFAEVKLHGMGEPLINKDFFRMTKFMSDRHIWVRTTTNGSLLHIKDNYKKLIDAEIGEVQCSVDGATKEIFEKIRRGSNFEQIVKNLTDLNNYANSKDRPYTRMWVLAQKDNRHQMLEFIDLAAKMNFKRVSFAMSLNDWGQEEWNDKNKSLQSQWELSEDEWNQMYKKAKTYGINLTIWRQGESYSTESVEKLCPWPFERPFVSTEFKMVPCCMISNPDVLELGDAKNMKEVWNGKEYRTFRKAHLDGDIPHNCRYCYGMEYRIDGDS